MGFVYKGVIEPLLIKYEDQVIQAKVSADLSILTDIIGEENFEELNDALNHIDYLARNGLETCIRNEESKKLSQKDSDTLLEYRNEQRRIEILYERIERYHLNKLAGEKQLENNGDVISKK